MPKSSQAGRTPLRLALAGALAALLPAGCSPVATTADDSANQAANAGAADDDEADATASDSNSTDMIVTRYSCEDGRAVIARYVNSAAVNAMVDLDIAGVKRQLPQGMSASGARYETDNGLNKGKKLVWWSKGNGAMLIESDLGDSQGASETIINCDQTAEVQ